MKALREELHERHPAVQSKAAQEAMASLVEQAKERHGPAFANDPQVLVLGAFYEALGGDERFAGDWYEEQIVEDIKGAGGGGNIFTS